MIFLFTFTVIAVVITTALWLSTLRQIDRITLFANIAMKFKLRKILQRRNLTKVKASNGFKILMPGVIGVCILDEILDFDMRPDDVIVATYTKAGTTWMQEIVWLICSNVDIEKATSERLTHRFGFLESLEVSSEHGKGFQSLEKWPRSKRRFIKTHLPLQLLPKQLQTSNIGKMVYVARNPKDNCVSFYHFHRMSADLPRPGTWSEFLKKFCDGDVMFGSWFDHVLKYWQVHQNRKESIYFVTYESLKRDLKGEVTRLAKFFEKDLSERQIDTIVEHCSFTSMRKNNKVNYSEFDKAGQMNFKVSRFMRKGEVGDWKNHFTINENKAFDSMFQERTKGWSLKLKFEPSEP